MSKIGEKDIKMVGSEVFDIQTKEGKTIVVTSKELSELIKTSILCNNARFEKVKDKYEIIGDPTENALISTALDFGINKKDLTEIPPEIKKGIKFRFVSSASEVLKLALDKESTKQKSRKNVTQKSSWIRSR